MITNAHDYVHTNGAYKFLKFEIRSTKYETNPNDKNHNVRNNTFGTLENSNLKFVSDFSATRRVGSAACPDGNSGGDIRTSYFKKFMKKLAQHYTLMRTQI